MKLLDYFNICFIIFVLLCIFFVMNNEYKLNILERYNSESNPCSPFELAHSCVYRIVNRLSNTNVYSLCQIRVIDLDTQEEEQNNELYTFYMFDKFDPNDIYSCIKHNVKYSKKIIETSKYEDFKYSNESEKENLKDEEDINKIIFKLLIDLENSEKVKSLELHKTYSFKFVPEQDEFGDGPESLRNIRCKIKGFGDKQINYKGSTNFKIFDNSTKNIEEDDANKEYVIICDTDPDIKMINKNGYLSKNLHKTNENDKQNDTDYYEELGILFLTQENICQLESDSKLIKEKNDGKDIILDDDYFKKYDKTSQIKSDKMCPKNVPYPYDTFKDNKKNFKFKYRYDIVEARNMCCSNVPTAKKNNDLNGPDNPENDEDDYDEEDSFTNDEDDDFYKKSDENEDIYTECDGDSKQCEGGKCNMYDIQKYSCVPTNHETAVMDPTKIKNLDDILNIENNQQDNDLFERMSFEIIKYYVTPDDSSKDTLNLLQSKFM